MTYGGFNEISEFGSSQRHYSWVTLSRFEFLVDKMLMMRPNTVTQIWSSNIHYSTKADQHVVVYNKTQLYYIRMVVFGGIINTLWI